MSNLKERRTKTIRLGSDLIQELEDLAEKDNRNFNNFVETILMRETQKHNMNGI